MLELELQQSALSSSSMWAAAYSWFTPTVLFLLLNLVIATIAFTSASASASTSANHPLARSPSLLHRLKSLSFRSADPPPLPDNLPAPSHYFFPDDPSHSPDVFQQEPTPPATVEETDIHYSGDFPTTAVDGVSGDGHVSRTKSDTKPASGEAPAKLAARMRKSASLKSAFGHFKEEEVAVVEDRRPATARGREKEKAQHEGDEEVDAKADDFINRFKEQLKLQRLDSIVRYRDMIGKGRGAQ